MEVLIFIAWLALCGVAAYIVANKGRSGVGVFFLSLFLSPLVGIIVAFSLSPNVEKVAVAQGKKKCPNCAEFVQPDAKTCRFCQHSFVEEEAEWARLKAEREAEREAERARQQAEYEASLAAEAAKPWIRRNVGLLVPVVLIVSCLGGITWYGITHPIQPYQQVSAVENKPVPMWITEERNKVPKSVWDKKVAWAIQHHCYFFGMSRDEIAQALGQPTEEQSYDLTYKHQTGDCARYDGDACAGYKSEQSIIFLQDGYTDPKLNGTRDGCRTSFGEHEYSGFDVPNFSRAKKARKTQ